MARLQTLIASIAATVAHTLSTAYRDAWGVDLRRAPRQVHTDTRP